MSDLGDNTVQLPLLAGLPAHAQKTTRKSRTKRQRLLEQGKEKEFPRSVWAILVKNRDGFACVRCGAIGTLHAHHIIPKKKHGKNLLSNGETLCIPCHKKVHARAPRPKGPGGKPGRPKSGKTVRKVTVMLPPWLHDWATQQPDGLTGLVRRLLLTEHARTQRKAKAEKKPPLP